MTILMMPGTNLRAICSLFCPTVSGIDSAAASHLNTSVLPRINYPRQTSSFFSREPTLSTQFFSRLNFDEWT